MELPWPEVSLLDLAKNIYDGVITSSRCPRVNLNQDPLGFKNKIILLSNNIQNHQPTEMLVKHSGDESPSSELAYGGGQTCHEMKDEPSCD